MGLYKWLYNLRRGPAQEDHHIWGSVASESLKTRHMGFDFGHYSKSASSSTLLCT